ncbi:MAG: VWA domain-containing protein [bacterium]|nr:VWA domain-containing protein [bacterium]
MIGFANYEYSVYIILVGVIVCALFVLYILWKRRMLEALLRGTGLRETLVRGSEKKARVKAILTIAAIVFSVLVLLRPQWGEKVREVHSEGSDVLIALDVSRSMLAQDVKPSRLEKAKSAIWYIAESLKGDRIGLILFAGDSFLQCPLTNDIGAFKMFLDAAGPDSIRQQGTDIGGALARAHHVFTKKRLTSKLLVLITDGEDHEGAVEAAIPKFKELDVSIYTVGVGRESGDYIPTKDDESSKDIYLKDKSDKLVRTKKDVGRLKNLAGATSGAYMDISDNLGELKFIFEIIEDQQKNEYGTRIIREKKEQFEIFGVILLLLLAVEIMIAERKGEGNRLSVIGNRLSVIRKSLADKRGNISGKE